jgi:hypothetical protein
MGIASSKVVTCFYFVFLFWGIISLVLTYLPRFRHVLDSFTAISINYPSKTSIYVGVLVVRICDFTSFLLSVNISSNWFAIPCK